MAVAPGAEPKCDFLRITLESDNQIEESPEGGDEARALGHDVLTEADTLEELKEAVRDVVICHFDEEERPRRVRLHLDMGKQELPDTILSG